MKMVCRAVIVWQPYYTTQKMDNMKMKYLKSIVTVAFLSLAVLLVFDSCSTSKNTASRKGDATAVTNTPDYEQIKKLVNSKSSNFYYPDLLRRFEAADTTLTVEQMYYFYYGTATRPDYSPYKPSNYDALHKALEKDNPEEKDWQEAARVIDEQLKTDPTNIRFHFYKQIVYNNLYGPESEKTFDAHNQVVMLISAVTSTGDGRSKETALHVICVTDEYGIMDVFGLSPKQQSLVHDDYGQSYDVMDLEKNEYGLESMYFNITVSMDAMNKMFGS